MIVMKSGLLSWLVQVTIVAAVIAAEYTCEFQGLALIGQPVYIGQRALNFTWKPAQSRSDIIFVNNERGFGFVPDQFGDYVLQGRFWRVIVPHKGSQVMIGSDRVFVDGFDNGQVESSDQHFMFWNVRQQSGLAAVSESSGHLHIELASQNQAPLHDKVSLSSTEPVFDLINGVSTIEMSGIALHQSGKPDRINILSLMINSTEMELFLSLDAANRTIAIAERKNGMPETSVVHRARFEQCSENIFPSSVLFKYTAEHWEFTTTCLFDTKNTVYSARGDHALRPYMTNTKQQANFDLVGNVVITFESEVIGNDITILEVDAVSIEITNSESVGIDQNPYPIPPLPVVFGPVVNGIKLGDGGLGPSQPMSKYGLLDVTKPPFSADPTGKSDSTTRLQHAIDFARSAYLTVFFPSGSYRVNDTLHAIEPAKMFLTTVGTPFCNNMVEAFPASNRTSMQHCSRTAPVVMQGSRLGSKPKIILSANSNLDGPVVRLHNPQNENINMNQVFSNIDIEIEDGNTQAQGIYARAAQGTSVQDVTIFAGSAAAGLVGGAGSGGSHINVTVIGGQVGMDLSSSQPSPTITAATLINQTKSGIVYDLGRQTLSLVGLTLVQHPAASGPAIDATAQISIADSVLIGGGSSANPVAVTTTSSLLVIDCYIKSFSIIAQAGNATVKADSSSWTHINTIAIAAPTSVSNSYSSPVYVNGSMVSGNYIQIEPSNAPPSHFTSQHSWGEDFPSFESTSLCNAMELGARGDFVTDDTKALQAALSNESCKSGIFFPKGYYAISAPLVLPQNAVLVGVSRIYSNIVPHASVGPMPNNGPWPLVKTASGPESFTTISALSLIVWHHTNATYALQWESDNGLWREAHTNRVDVNPGVVGPAVDFNQPLNQIVNGGGQFYNFYQENWEYEGPKYRHLVVTGNSSSPLRFYHLNTEHSQGEANSEFINVSSQIRIYGFKGEGNYVQIWFRDCKDVLLLGYGGNASPFPFDCYYPHGYAQYHPSLFRFERVEKLAVGHLITQTSKVKTGNTCGIFGTGFAGTMYDPAYWRSILDVQQDGSNISTPSQVWPVLYLRA